MSAQQRELFTRAELPARLPKKSNVKRRLTKEERIERHAAKMRASPEGQQTAALRDRMKKLWAKRKGADMENGAAPTFTTAEVTKRTGLTQRKLQWWDEQEIVSPKHLGHSRQYTAEDIKVLRIVSTLRNKGVPLQRVAHMISTIRRKVDGFEHGILTTDSRSVTVFQDYSAAGNFAARFKGSLFIVQW